MGEVLKSVLFGLLRYALAGVFTWMIDRGIATKDQTEMLLGGIVGAIALVAVLFWRKYKDRVLVLTALTTAPGTSLNELKDQVAKGAVVPASTSNDATPRVTKDLGSVKILRSIALPVLLAGSLAGGIATSGCATMKPNPTISEAQAARNDGAVLAKATTQALDFAIEARRRAQSFYDAGSLSADKMIAINTAAEALGKRSLDFIAFAKTVTTRASLKATATALYGLFGEYIAKLKLEGWSGDVINAALDAFRAYLGVK